MKREREREGERKKGEREKVSDRNKEKLNSTLGSIGMLCNAYIKKLEFYPLIIFTCDG